MMTRFEKLMDRLGWMRKPEPAPISRQLTEQEMLAAFASHTALYEAVQSELESAIYGCNVTGQKPTIAANHGVLAYYAGAASHLEQFRERLYAWRERALKASQG